MDSGSGLGTDPQLAPHSSGAQLKIRQRSRNKAPMPMTAKTSPFSQTRMSIFRLVPKNQHSLKITACCN
jgi:hypothetical protein